MPASRRSARPDGVTCLPGLVCQLRPPINIFLQTERYVIRACGEPGGCLISGKRSGRRFEFWFVRVGARRRRKRTQGRSGPRRGIRSRRSLASAAPWRTVCARSSTTTKLKVNRDRDRMAGSRRCSLGHTINTILAGRGGEARRRPVGRGRRASGATLATAPQRRTGDRRDWAQSVRRQCDGDATMLEDRCAFDLRRRIKEPQPSRLLERTPFQFFVRESPSLLLNCTVLLLFH